MTDNRVTLFGTFWAEQYKDLHSVSYPWVWGKDQKHIKGALKWFEKEFSENTALDQMKIAACRYLQSTEPFIVKRMWPVTDFCLAPQRFVVIANKPAPVETKEPVPEVLPPIEEAAFEAFFVDAPKMLKGFVRTCKAMRKVNAPLHDRIRERLLALLGAETCHKLFEQESKKEMLDSL